MAVTVLLYLAVLAGFIPAGYVAWSLKRAADALEAHNRARAGLPDSSARTYVESPRAASAMTALLVAVPPAEVLSDGAIDLDVPE